VLFEIAIKIQVEAPDFESANGAAEAVAFAAGDRVADEVPGILDSMVGVTVVSANVSALAEHDRFRGQDFRSR
jgi:hypothetical protein